MKCNLVIVNGQFGWVIEESSNHRGKHGVPASSGSTKIYIPARGFASNYADHNIKYIDIPTIEEESESTHEKRNARSAKRI